MAPAHEPPGNGTKAADPRAQTEALYLAQWEYVLRILPSYGVPVVALADLSQSVWVTVQERIASYDPEIHKTPRAWLTGVVRRCAANYRRMRKRRPEVLTDELGSLAVAPGLDPERAVLLRSLHRMIRDPDRYEAFLLRLLEGLSIEEIAAATGATASAVEWRIRMAKKDLEEEDDGTNKRGAFLGFGSLEALVEALRPKPLPPELGAEQWKEISRRIQAGDKPEFDDSEPPSSSAPPPSAVPASTPSTTVAATIGKGTTGGLVLLAFFVGALGGGFIARHESDRALSLPTDQPFATQSRITPEPADTASTSSATPPSGPSTKATSPSSTSARSTTPSAVTGASLRLILQMRHAAETGNADAVLALADEHARTFPYTDVAEREAERRRATEQLRRRDAASRPAQ